MAAPLEDFGGAIAQQVIDEWQVEALPQERADPERDTRHAMQDTVDDGAVQPLGSEYFANPHQRLDDEESVEFIEVVFILQERVQGTESLQRIPLPGSDVPVNQPAQPEPDSRHPEGGQQRPEAERHCCRLLETRRPNETVEPAGRQIQTQKVLWDADPAVADRKNRQDHQR